MPNEATVQETMCCEEPLKKKKKTLLLAESEYLQNLNITNLFALNLPI